MEKNIKRNFIWNIIGTTFSSFNSLFFMIIVTRITGINDAGIFTFAFSTACLFYVIGTYSGRTYQVTERGNCNDSDYLYTKIFTCIIMIICALIFCFIRKYEIFKFSIIILLCIYKMLEAFSESLYAIIQKNNELYKVGKSLFYKAIISLLSFFIILYISNNLLIATLCIIFSNLLIIIVYDFYILKKMNFKLEKINYNKIWLIIKNGFFTFGFTFLTLYVTNAPKYVIDFLLNNQAQTIFGIIIMPATIIILFSQFIIQPFLMKMKEVANEGMKKYRLFILKLLLAVFVIGIIIIFITYLFGIPFLELLYNVKLEKYLECLLLVILGATFYGISAVLSTALTTIRKTFGQFIIYIISSIFVTIISIILIKKDGIYGAFNSYLLTMIFLLVLYIILYIVKTREVKENEKK